jgi:hypothetical protein
MAIKRAVGPAPGREQAGVPRLANRGSSKLNAKRQRFPLSNLQNFKDCFVRCHPIRDIRFFYEPSQHAHFWKLFGAASGRFMKRFIIQKQN